MGSLFAAGGRNALAKGIIRAAASQRSEHPQPGPHDYHAVMAEGWVGCYVFQLLESLPDYIIESLISGTIMHDYGLNPRVRSFVDNPM